jgi:hypothetical protein
LTPSCGQDRFLVCKWSNHYFNLVSWPTYWLQTGLHTDNIMTAYWPAYWLHSGRHNGCILICTLAAYVLGSKVVCTLTSILSTYRLHIAWPAYWMHTVLSAYWLDTSWLHIGRHTDCTLACILPYILACIVALGRTVPIVKDKFQPHISL